MLSAKSEAGEISRYLRPLEPYLTTEPSRKRHALFLLAVVVGVNSCLRFTRAARDPTAVRDSENFAKISPRLFQERARSKPRAKEKCIISVPRRLLVRRGAVFGAHSTRTTEQSAALLAYPRPSGDLARRS